MDKDIPTVSEIMQKENINKRRAKLIRGLMLDEKAKELYRANKIESAYTYKNEHKESNTDATRPDKDKNRPGLKRMNSERDIDVPPTAGGKRRVKTLKTLKRRSTELSQSGGKFVKDITIEERVSKIERDIAYIKKQISDFTGIGNRLRIDDRVEREKNKVLYQKANLLGIDRENYENQNDFVKNVNLSWNKYNNNVIKKTNVGGKKSKKKLTFKKKL